MSTKIICRALLSAALTFSAPAWSETQTTDPEAYRQNPWWRGQQYVAGGEWRQMEETLAHYASTGERDSDGQFKLYEFTLAANNYLALWNESLDSQWSAKFAQYLEEFPDSSFQPIVTAMHLRITAHRVLGSGFPEGDKLYGERIVKAWNLMLASKKQASRIPTFYEWAITMGRDAGIPEADIADLFNEGIKRFPGYHAIYFAYLRGHYVGAASLDKFVQDQVAAKANPDGEALYARLYWFIYQQRGNGAEFFRDTKVSWPRMRASFEKLIAAYPDSARNKASLAAFACRASDASTYLKWRPGIHPGVFETVTREDGLSLEVCDARFTKST